MTNVLDLETLTLESGSHSNFERGACLLEAASYMAGEPFSDSPQCVSNVLGVFGRRLNDKLSDDERQQLKPFIPRLLNTAEDGQDRARGYLATDWLVRTLLPLRLENAGQPVTAERLRRLAPITDGATSRAARLFVRDVRSQMWELRKTAVAKLADRLREELAKRGLTAADADAAAAAAADADAAAAADADAAAAAYADAAADDYWEARRALRATMVTRARERAAQIRPQLVASQIDLLDRMIDPSQAA